MNNKWFSRGFLLATLIATFCFCLETTDTVSAQSSSSRDIKKIAERIDQEIAKQLQEYKIPSSPLADDAMVLRRVYLDLTGQIPPYEKAIAFLDSKDPQKRTRLVDELLEGPEYGEHFATIWTNLLLRPETSSRDRVRFQKWLAKRLNDNDGWDKIAFDLLTAEGDPAKVPAAVFSMAQSDNNRIQPNLLAASTTRYFLGVQLQCAECHDHPFTEWKQTDFWGVAAFYSRVRYLKKSKNTPVSGVHEVLPNSGKKGKKAKDDGAAIRIPNTAGEAKGTLVKARFLGGEAPSLQSDEPFRPSLASWVTSKDNKYFARAAVNRLWAQLFGRGLVNPVDDMHADNPSSHPELLELLDEEFRASDFDLKHLLRCITASETYQRSSQPVSGNKDDHEMFSHMNVKVMPPEVLYEALTRSMGVKDLKITIGGLPTLGIIGKKKRPTGSPREQFVKFFNTRNTDSVATDFTHGIPQALSLLNDPEFNKPGPTVNQLIKEKLPQEQALEKLFVITLARRPTADETRILTRYLEKQTDPAQAYAGALWILFNTPEFTLIR